MCNNVTKRVGSSYLHVTV